MDYAKACQKGIVSSSEKDSIYEWIQFLEKRGSTSIHLLVNDTTNIAMRYYYAYLQRRYHHPRTRLYGDDVDINLDRLNVFTNLHYLSSKILKQHSILIIPISFTHISGDGHYNLLIYRRNIQTLEHYEPHGSGYPCATEKIKQIYRLLKRRCSGLKFISSSVIHGNHSSLQTIRDNVAVNDGGGFCVAWCYFMAELIMRNTSVDTKKIYSKLQSFITLHHIQTEHLIVGYAMTHQINIGLYKRHVVDNNGYAVIGSPNHLKFYDEFFRRYF